MTERLRHCFPPAMFIDRINLEEFICACCQGVMREAVLDPCNHRISRECLKSSKITGVYHEYWIPTYMKGRALCPISKKIFYWKQVVPIQSAIELFPTAKTRCAHFEKCDWSGTFAELYRHLEQDCLHELVKNHCQNSGCPSKVLPKAALESHPKECTARPMKCISCDSKFKFTEIGNHSFFYCAAKVNECSDKCGRKIRRDDHKHEFYCPYRKVYCGFSMMECGNYITRGELLQHCSSKETVKHHLLLALDYFLEKNELVFNKFKLAANSLHNFVRGLEKKCIINRSSKKAAKTTMRPSDNRSYLTSGGKSFVSVLKAVDQKAGMDSSLDSLKLIAMIEGRLWLPDSKLYEGESLNTGLTAALRAKSIILLTRRVKSGVYPSSFTDQSEDLDQEKVLEFVEPNSPLNCIVDYTDTNFSTKNSFGPISIANGKLITRISDSAVQQGGLVLLSKPLLPFYDYGFTADRSDCDLSKIGFGICKLENAMKSGYTISSDDDHRCYIAFMNHEIIINGNSNRLKAEPMISSRLSQSIRSFYYDSELKELRFMNVNGYMVHRMDLSKEKELTDFYPCVFMATDVKITPADSFRLRFHEGYSSYSSVFKAPHTMLLNDGAYYTQKAVGFLDWPIKSGQPYRFKIEQRNSETMGFGIYFKDQVQDYREPTDPHKPRLFLVMFGNQEGPQKMPNYHISEYRFRFDTGDIVEILFEYFENRLTFTNQSSGKRIQQSPLCEMPWVPLNIYIGVILSEGGDSVRILAD